jgi:phage shock protein PspC (stress-responsive transcriptional regulator)
MDNTSNQHPPDDASSGLSGPEDAGPSGLSGPEDAGPSEPAGSSRPAGAGTRRLTRDIDRRVFGGVASGLAAYFGVDPLIGRLAFVAFGVLGFPFSILLYLIAWAVVPPSRGYDPDRPRERGVPTWVWVVLAVFVAFWIVVPLMAAIAFFTGGPFGFDGSFGFDGPFFLWRPGIFWAFLLVGLGILLFRRSEAGSSSAASPAATAVDADPSASPSALPAPHRPRSVLGRITVAAALVVAGVAALLENFGVLDLNARQGTALLLVVVGGGLLAGAWWGRALWLILPGILLVPILLMANFAGLLWDERFNAQTGPREEYVRVTSNAQVDEPFERARGNLILDLTQLPLSAAPTEVQARVGAGQLEVLVPADTDVEVVAMVAAGTAAVFGQRLEGPGLEVRDTDLGEDGGGQLSLDLEVGFGEMEVRRVDLRPTDNSFTLPTWEAA